MRYKFVLFKLKILKLLKYSFGINVYEGIIIYGYN